jgi:hypothetical protein
MIRLMFDGISATTVPAGAAIYAGYVDGKWASYQPLADAYPGALHVSITTEATGSARVLDVETGDALPTQAPAWVTKERANGNAWPVVYMNASTWPAVRAAFTAQNVAEPLYWVAAYVTDPSTPPVIPDGVLAVQFYDYGGYDASTVVSHWPGLDPARASKPAHLSEEDMNATSINGRAGLSWAAGTKHVIQVTYDPAAGDPILRLVLALTTGPLVFTGWHLAGGSGVYEIPEQYIASCRGMILEATVDTVIYDTTVV